VITPGTNLLQNVKGDSIEIIAEFQTNAEVDCFGFRVRVGDGEQTTIGYNAQQRKVFVDRSNSGQSNFDEGFAGIHFADMEPVDGIIRLLIFIDRSSVEVFGNDGLVVLSDSIFPDEHSQGLELFTQGSEITLKALDVYELLPAHFTLLN
jgi:fructan beta-fructosidase